MHPRFVPDRRRAAVGLLVATLAAGCAAAGPTPAPVATSPTPATTDQPTEPPTQPPPTPVVSVPPTAPFVTAPPPAPGVAWTGMAWRRLAPDDALGSVRSMVRWRRGFLAVGAPVVHEPTASTPVWTSADGATWTPLDGGALGPTAIVVGAGEVASQLVAVTVEGGREDCGPADSTCWSAGLPVRAWTSSDGRAWTVHPMPDLGIEPSCEGCGVDAPLVAIGRTGALVVARNPGGARVALSADGATWTVLPAGAFPATFEVGAVAAVASGFVVVGQLNGDNPVAAAMWSADGQSWQRGDLPTPGVKPEDGSTASRLAAGPSGIVAEGSDQLTPGREIWWTSADGRTWSASAAYPPLGVWQGEGQGSGLLADGQLMGDGERLVAYRAGPRTAGWTSADGATWSPLDVGRDGPAGAIDFPTSSLVLLPAGLLWLADDGTAWFGEPAS